MRFLALTGASTLPVTMDLMVLSLLLIARSLRNETRRVTRRGVELLTPMPEHRGRFATELGLKSQVRAL